MNTQDHYTSLAHSFHSVLPNNKLRERAAEIWTCGLFPRQSHRPEEKHELKRWHLIACTDQPLPLTLILTTHHG